MESQDGPMTEPVIWISTISEELYQRHYGDAIRTWHHLPGRKIMLFDGAPPALDFIEFIDYWSVIDRNNSWFSKKQSKKVVRLSYKAWAIHWAVTTLDCERVVWLDADVVVHKPVPVDLINNGLNLWSSLMFYKTAGIPTDPALVLHKTHAVETGLQIFNMRHPDIQTYIEQYIDYYRTELAYELVRPYDNWISSAMTEFWPLDNLVSDPAVIRAVGEDTFKFTRFGPYMTHYLGKGNKQNIPKNL